jgi:pyrroline-5-carboxylate reductase
VDTLVELSHLPRNRVVKMICLPNVCRREGVCLVTPPLDHCVISSRFWLQRLFTTLGGYLECATEAKMQTLMVISGLMGPMYGILKTEATFFVTRTYQSMIQDAATAAATTNDKRYHPNDHNQDEDCTISTNTHTIIDDLIEEQTPGGINEQAYNILKQHGLDSMYRGTMDAILLRLEKGGVIEGDVTT